MTEVNAAARAPKNVFEREETVAGWDDDYYHPISIKYYDRAVADMLNALKVEDGGLVLDAGCGPGVHSIRAARLGARVKAVDLSERMLEHARHRAGEAGVAARIEFSQGDLTALSLESNAFPHVFSWGVIIHIPDAEKALGHLVRVTTPGGRLALQIMNAGSFEFRLETFLRSLFGKKLAGLVETRVGKGVWYDYNDDRLWVQRFDLKRLESWMQERGCKLVSVRAAEFTEVQRRVPRAVRPAVFWFNRLAYLARFPAFLSCTAIVVFEKSAS